MNLVINNNSSGLDKSDVYLRVAIAIWTLSILVVGMAIFLAPMKHTVTHVYNYAVQQWLEDKSIYDSGNFHYFPQFIFLFMPFHSLPSPFGDVMWRAVSIGLLSWGLWRIINLVQLPQNKLLFL